MLTLALLCAIGSAGYLGGGGDDWYYLQAARCVANHIWCVPETHWASRWPLVAPMAAALAFFGESRASIGLAPFVYTLAATVLFAANVERRFGWTASMLGTVALVLIPTFMGTALQPAIDTAEFAWLLAALLAMQHALEYRRAPAAMLAGAGFAMAVLSRATSLAFVPLIALGWLALPASRRLLILPFALGAAAILGMDAVRYLLLAGDPLLGWSLALHHGAIPSSELAPGFDRSQSPLLNLDFIRHWRRSMGIEVHWSVDPLLNLLADPLSGLTLIGAGGLTIVKRASLATMAGRRWLAGAAGAAFAHFLLLTFVLAIDPKPRMFLPDLGVAAAVIGVVGSLAWREERSPLIVALLALMGLRSALLNYEAADLRPVEIVAQQWAAGATRNLTVDDWTRRTLALVPEVQALPASGPARSLQLSLSTQRCADVVGEGRRLIVARAFPRRDPPPVAWLRAHNLGFGTSLVPLLCVVDAS